MFYLKKSFVLYLFKTIFLFFILSLVRKNEARKNAGPDEMAKFSVLGAKTSKFGFVLINIEMRVFKGYSFLKGDEEGRHRRFLTLLDGKFLTPFTSKAGTDTNQHLRLA